MLDTTVDIATPEGVELKLPVAGLAPRSLAWLIDALIKGVAFTVLSLALEFLGKAGDGFALIATFLILWFYNVLFEVLNRGMTPGKNALGLRVVNANGTPVGWTGSILRNLLRFVDMLPGCYAFGCLSVLLSRKFQRLGDLAADTIVVFRPPAARSTPVSAVAPQPVHVPLDISEQQAIISYGERAAALNRERAEEIAAILEPVLPNASRDRVSAWASWLSGGGAPH